MISRTVPILALLAGCASPPAPWCENGDPITAEDLGPLPARATPENSLRVIRQCLQRDAATSPAGARVRYTYFPRSLKEFRVHPGFVRKTLDGDRESTEGVEYRAISEISVHREPSWKVILRGGFTMGSGGATYGMVLEHITIPCRDEETATKLAAALRLAPRE